MRISEPIDTVMAWLKWPVALAAVWLLPGAAIAVVHLLRRVVHQPTPLLPFLGGCVLYAILWHVVFRHRVLGSFLSTFEHEMTHALFALASFHRVVGLSSSWNAGGRTSFLGRGNWLITISPYFFPTLCALLILALAFVPRDLRIWLNGLMGFVFAYHIFSTRQETHAGQSDLHRVGFVFSWMFLPAANLLSMGSIVAFSYDGLDQVAQFVSDAALTSWSLTASLFG